MLGIMELLVYGDESADGTECRVFAVSGLVANESEWQRTEVAWRAVTGGEVFHAAKWEHAGRRDEYKALVHVLAASPVGGIVYAIDLAAFHDVFEDMLDEAAYLKGVGRIISGIAENAIAFNQRMPAAPIKRVVYTFDQRAKTQFIAKKHYEALLAEPGWTPGALMAPKLLFSDRSDSRIQMADMIAREGMKDLDRIVGPVPFAERRSKIELARKGQFRFFVLGRESFEHDRQRGAELASGDGFSQTAYHEWLVRAGAQDNWENRLKFLALFNAAHPRIE